MSHNATGYSEDMNPDLIDGISNPRETWALNNSRLATRAEQIVRKLDPHRIVYHHSSGNLGSMYTINFYSNFAPIQEQSDWFEHWATKGVKPLFTCEYSVPFTWDWTMYRGWYNGQREFGSARVPWEFCLAEWNAQFLGDRAYQISEMEKANLRWEAKQFRAGALWHRWDYPCDVGSTRLEERYPVFAMYISDNWRAFRTWGVSANSPWEYGHYWKLRSGVDRSRKEFKTDWENLQRPGFSPDYIDQRYERMDLAYESRDWIPTAAAQALILNNQPLLAYIGGKSSSFTSKDHNFQPGSLFEKQLIIINNTREPVACRCLWVLQLPTPVVGNREITVPAGEQARIPLRMKLPENLGSGQYALRADVSFSNGDVQSDSFIIDVVPILYTPQINSKVALFDPVGETRQWLERLAIGYRQINPQDSLSGYDMLIIGKGALKVDGPAPDISRVRSGLKVLLFEQKPEVLEKRFGFRIAEYGLRWVFKRIPDHPTLAGISEEHLRNWQGESTLSPPRLQYEMRPRYGPTVQWCGIPVTRLWRCGNRGNVATVLIEKPSRGDFLPILDGGYSLQYSPLLEYREGQGLVLFCQMDVTGRTEVDPAADALARNLIKYVSTWKPTPKKAVLYAGESQGKGHIESAGFLLKDFSVNALSTSQLMIIGPNFGQQLIQYKPTIDAWLNHGGRILAVGLNEQEAKSYSSNQVSMKKGEHIAAWFAPFKLDSLLAGVSPADVHNRDPRELSLLSGGCTIFGNGVLAASDTIVFYQIAPWHFANNKQPNFRRTFRRTSFLLSRLMGNMGAESATPMLQRFNQPMKDVNLEKRWLDGFYLDTPEEWDDPYRFFRW